MELVYFNPEGYARWEECLQLSFGNITKLVVEVWVMTGKDVCHISVPNSCVQDWARVQEARGSIDKQIYIDKLYALMGV